MSDEGAYYVISPELEKTMRSSATTTSATSGSQIIEEETVTKKRITTYDNLGVIELISKVDILLQEVEDLISAIRDTPTPGKNLNGLRTIIREEIGKVISETGAPIVENMIELRDIPRDQAKEEIMALLDKSDKLYYYDIAEALRLDLELVVELVNELEREGLVGGAE